jgi:CBS domain-containing protein
MLVKDFLQGNPHQLITARESTSVHEAMALLINNKISCLPVVNDDAELIGIISEKDIFRAAHKSPSDFTKAKVADLMTSDLIVGLAEDECDYIAGVMTQNRIRHVPIVKEKRLIGLVSVGDIVKSQLTSIKIENRYLKQYIHDQYPG